MLKAIAFDMDGVLIDSEYTYIEAKTALLHDLGIDKEESFFYQFMGTTREYTWQATKELLGLPGTVESYIEDMDRRREEILARDGVRPIQGAVEVVKKLHELGIPMAVASSTEKPRIISNLEAVGIKDCFDFLISGEEVAHSKPAPDTYLKACEKLGFQPKDCLAVEDSNNGVHAAHSAGLYTLAYVNPTYPAPDLSVTQDHFSDYADFLAKVLPLFQMN